MSGRRQLGIDFSRRVARQATEPAPDAPRVWSVSALNRAARHSLERRFPEVWVSGEVANWTRARSGHRYFTLRDDEAQLRAVMWARDAARLPTDPLEGMKVRAFGSLTIYAARGSYQIAVRRLEGEGEEGLWRLAFERTRAALEADGLLDPGRKRPVPRYPASVGIVTSLGGAALHDILTVIRRRAPWTRVVVRGSRVQGEGAAGEIADGVRTLGASGEVEVLIVGRGGGSIEDLWAFNEEIVARAIADSPVPVISAVGHEVDVTLSDLVADLRAPTPSAAGERAVEDGSVLAEVLLRTRQRLELGLRAQVSRRRERLRDGSLRARRAIEGLLAPLGTGLEHRSARLERAVSELFAARRAKLAAVAGQIEALSPLGTLRRGYAVPLDRRARVMRTASEFRAGEPFVLRVVDGRIHCETLRVQEEADR